MPSNYPNTFDAWTNPSSGTLMNAPGFEHDIAHANVYDAIEKIQAELGTNPSGASATVKDRLDAATFSTVPYVTVASSTLPPAAAAGCNYQCSGTNDQTQINNALDKASRINDGFGGEGWIGVLLVGETFSVGHNGIPILIYPNTTLTGLGQGTLIQPSFPTGYLGGAIEVVHPNAHRFTIRDLSIGNPTATTFNGSGIRLTMNDTGQTYEIKSSNDGNVRIENVSVFRSTQRGIWLEGGRAARVHNIHTQATIKEGLYIDNHSDSKISKVVATGLDGTAAGIHISGGNTMMSDSKVAFRGNDVGGGTPQHGFFIDTSRVSLSNCQAQDNGGYGFYIDGSDHSLSNCMADSNGAQDATKGGFFISASGSYTGLVASDRQQNVIRQNRGIVFDGAPQVYMTGRVGVDSGSNHVVGSPGANSYVRLVRDGATLHSVG